MDSASYTPGCHGFVLADFEYEHEPTCHVFSKEGMSEVDLSTELYSVMVEEGHHGLCRFGMFDTEMVLGNVCFGESSIYPSYFNGPGGMCGMSPVVP